MEDIATVSKPRGGGRPRSEATRRLILTTTLKLLENETLQSITIEAIAKEAGVSKATIYRWWDSKASIVIEAFIEHHIVKTPMRRDIPPGEAVVDHLRHLIEQYSGFPGRIVAQILSEGQSDPVIAREFRERFHYGRRAIVRETMEEWRRSGDIDPSTNVEMLMDVLYAPVYMRLLLGHAPLDEKFAEDLPAFVYGLLGAKLPKSSR
ncbi:MAG TPA: TetR/AcrR family transcriptional regulator [Sphingomonas sp.]|nr:TetR/AcrR family transcriptional regulator [Sphingomonas sp.]